MAGKTMSTRRTHVLLPVDLLREIDALVGSRNRTSFLVEAAWNEVRRRRLLQLLEKKRQEQARLLEAFGAFEVDPAYDHKTERRRGKNRRRRSRK